MARIEESSGYLRVSGLGLAGVEVQGRACPEAKRKLYGKRLIALIVNED
jgi:hypothetical protein